jgi:hypothetical protein
MSRKYNGRGNTKDSGSLPGKVLQVLLAPFFFLLRTAFSFVLLSVISFLVFYFYMQGTPERQQHYTKVMEAAEQVPSVLGGLAQQAGYGEFAKSLGYEAKPGDAQHSKELMKTLCGQLAAVDEAEELPWKKEPAPAPAQVATPIAEAPIAEAPVVEANEPVEPLPPEQAAVVQDVPAVPEGPEDTVQEEVVTPAPAETAATPAVPVPATPAADETIVPEQLQPIMDALKNAKNIDTIREKLSVRYVGQKGEGAVLFLSKLLDKDKGALRLAALESLRRIGTPEALAVLYKHTQPQLVPSAPPVPPAAAAPPVAIPVIEAVPPAPVAAPAPQQEPVAW